MTAAAVEDGIVLLEYADRPMLDDLIGRIASRLGATPAPGSDALIDRLAVQLEEYFAGRLQSFDVPFVMSGTTFEEQCWEWMRTIPVGQTRTYAAGAAAIGRPRSARAVGRALVPCHRVVGSGGELAGYGGGTWRKRALLDLEARSAVAPAEAAQRGEGAKPQLEVFMTTGAGCAI
jgi:O-6-methylguanine DNA methyltransferase